MTAVGVLGPLLLQGPDGPVRLGSARQRRLLAALVARHGTPAGAEQLADLVWEPGGLPIDPAGAVQTHVARLRRLLPGGVDVVTAPEGYRLEVARDCLDVTAFADHLAAAAAAHDPQVRLARLAGGLALWRGRPYLELDHPSLQPELARLAALHLSACEQHAATLLELGRAGEAVAALEALVADEPLRESAVGLLVRALVAAGRPSDGLAAYRRLRARLADELGLDPSPALRALEEQVLRQELPPALPRPAPTPPVRLPVSAFVGRDDDVRAAAQALAGSRVLTLCGPGGVGKTRLALHVAAAVADRYDEGVVVVELGDGGPDDVEATLAAALRLSDAGSAPFAERVVEALAVRHQLLLLDNCEHVAAQAAPLVEAITTGAATVDVLVTSREPLRVDGEHVFAVRPLQPAAAVALLDDRLHAVDRDTGAEPERDALLDRLCRRLDGLPLALELAAARAPSLGLRGLLEALDEPLDVLSGGRGTTSPRHRSLRDVVAWSHGLLDADQQRLFEQLSVFAAPVEQAAVAAVCDDPAPLPDLVDRSLVVRHPGAVSRYGLLETLRAFGRSRLATDPDARRLRVRHAAWAHALAGELADQRHGPHEGEAVRRFDAHLPDLRRAHAWLREHGPVEDLLRLSVLFADLGALRGRSDLVQLAEDAVEAADRLAPTGARTRPAELVLRAQLQAQLATSCWQRGELDLAQDRARRALAAADAAGDRAAGHLGHEALGSVALFRGALADAAVHLERALSLATAAADRWGRVLALVDLVVVSSYAQDDDAAARYEAALLDAQGMDAPPTVRAYVHYAQGERRAERGRPDAAAHLEAAIAAAEAVDATFVAGIARHTLLTSGAREGLDPAAALPAFGPLLDHWQGFGAWTQWWIAVRALTGTLSRLGRHEQAMVLLGAAEASPAAPEPFGADLVRSRAVEQAARAALGPAADEFRARGRALEPAEAVVFARRTTRDTDGSGGRG